MSTGGPSTSSKSEVTATASIVAAESTTSAALAAATANKLSQLKLPQSTTTFVTAILSNAGNKVPHFDLSNLSKLTTNNNLDDNIKFAVLSTRKIISCSSVLDGINVQNGIFEIAINQSAIIIPSNISDLKSLEDILKRGHFEKMLKKNHGFQLLFSGEIQGPGELWDRILDLILTFQGRVLLRHLSAHKLETTDTILEKMFIKMIISKFPHIDAVIDPKAKEHKLQAEDNTNLTRFDSISSCNITETLFFMHNNNTGSVDSPCFERSISGEFFIQLPKKVSPREQKGILRGGRGNNNSSSSSSSSSASSDNESDKPRERWHDSARNH